MKFSYTKISLACLGIFLGTSSLNMAFADQISDDEIRIGFITDMASVYSDLDGKGGAEAIKMAIEDAGGEIDGKKITLDVADHQMKADIASSKAREWFDRKNIDLLIGGANSAAGLAMAGVAHKKERPYIAIGAGASGLTNDQCTPYTIHYAYDTVALARGTGSAVVDDGGKSWYFMTVDYAFGHSLENETVDVVKKSGGEVAGSVKIPLGTSDFSSYILQAQSSNADILAFANVGGDLVKSIKAAHEFGVNDQMNFAGLLMFINDVNALGLDTTAGMYLTTPWYWDLNDETREWAERFEDRVGRKPNMVQAANYSATRYYLEGIKATGTDNPEEMMKWMKGNKINDMFVKDGYIRKDGRLINDLYLAQVKSPEESAEEWDYYKIIKTIPGKEVYMTPEESSCYLWKED